MYKLIADSGSTKTDWVWVDAEGKIVLRHQSVGLNPYHLDEEQIVAELRQVASCMDDAGLAGKDCVKEVHFYGSGVTEAMKPLMESLLQGTFANAECHAESDLLGAARALFGHDKGFAVILGTGSNSGCYDGQKIVCSMPPLGYILGDEGSGTAIGKVFLKYILRCSDAEPLKELFFKTTGLDYAGIINKVYREPQANKFLASIAKFVGDQLENLRQLRKKYGLEESERIYSCPSLSEEDLPYAVACNNLESIIRELLDEATNDMFDYYYYEVGKEFVNYPWGYVGSIAAHFATYFAVDEPEDNCCEVVLQSPIERLAAFHS